MNFLRDFVSSMETQIVRDTKWKFQFNCFVLLKYEETQLSVIANPSNSFDANFNLT